MSRLVCLLAALLLAMPAAAREPPALELPDLAGMPQSLAQWRGKVVVINFWASWCPPCIEEIPDLVAFQRKHREQGLRVVGVGLDSAHKLGNVARTLGIDYPVLVAGEAGAAQLLQRWGDRSGVIPYTVVVDRAGEIAFTYRGPLDMGDFARRLAPLLDGLPVRD